LNHEKFIILILKYNFGVIIDYREIRDYMFFYIFFVYMYILLKYIFVFCLYFYLYFLFLQTTQKLLFFSYIVLVGNERYTYVYICVYISIIFKKHFIRDI